MNWNVLPGVARTLTPDGSEAVVELGRGNAYAQWANATVSSLIGCWGSLRSRPAGG